MASAEFCKGLAVLSSAVERAATRLGGRNAGCWLVLGIVPCAVHTHGALL